jgi:hypothetical protein
MYGVLMHTYLLIIAKKTVKQCYWNDEITRPGTEILTFVFKKRKLLHVLRLLLVSRSRVV